MEEALTPAQQLLDILIQVIVIAVPIVITWFLRTYVQGTHHERRLAAVVRISNAAIDYVENLDKRNELNVPENYSRGLFKLSKAGAWMEQELQRAGIDMSSEEAKEWIASEFQNRMGGVTTASKLAGLASTAVEVIQSLEANNLIDLPTEADRLVYMTGIGTDWVVARAAEQGVTVSREEALTWVRGELLNQLHTQIDRLPDNAVTDMLGDLLQNLPPNEQLAELAKRAVEFAQKLSQDGRLKLKPGRSGGNLTADVALGWLVTKAGELGLDVTTDELAAALYATLEKEG